MFGEGDNNNIKYTTYVGFRIEYYYYNHNGGGRYPTLLLYYILVSRSLMRISFADVEL